MFFKNYNSKRKEYLMSNKEEMFLADLLRQTKEVLDKKNIEFWLDAGTILGAVRSGRFISWDHDVDLGIWYDKISEDTKMLVCEELYKKGLKIRIAESHMNIKSEREPELWIDLNFYRLRGDDAIIPVFYPRNLIGKSLYVLWSILASPDYPSDFKRREFSIKRFIVKILVSITRNISRVIPSFLRKRIAYIIFAVYKRIGSKDVSPITPSTYFKNLSIIKFYGMQLKVPAKIEEYLIYKYGEDWQIPKTKKEYAHPYFK